MDWGTGPPPSPPVDRRVIVSSGGNSRHPRTVERLQNRTVPIYSTPVNRDNMPLVYYTSVKRNVR